MLGAETRHAEPPGGRRRWLVLTLVLLLGLVLGGGGGWLASRKSQPGRIVPAFILLRIEHGNRMVKAGPVAGVGGCRTFVARRTHPNFIEVEGIHDGRGGCTQNSEYDFRDVLVTPDVPILIISYRGRTGTYQVYVRDDRLFAKLIGGEDVAPAEFPDGVPIRHELPAAWYEDPEERMIRIPKAK